MLILNYCSTTKIMSLCNLHWHTWNMWLSAHSKLFSTVVLWSDFSLFCNTFLSHLVKRLFIRTFLWTFLDQNELGRSYIQYATQTHSSPWNSHEIESIWFLYIDTNLPFFLWRSAWLSTTYCLCIFLQMSSNTWRMCQFSPQSFQNKNT